MYSLEWVRKQFKEWSINDMSAKTFFNFEMRIYVLTLLENDVLLKDGWSVFTQYFYELIDDKECESIQQMIFRLRYNNHTFSMSGNWKSLVEKYLKVPSSLRIYNQDELGNIERITARYENDREAIYKRSIEDIVIERKREVIFGDEDEEITYEKKAFSVPIFNEVCKGEINNLPVYRSKKYIMLEEESPWRQVLNEMGEKFANRPDIQLRILNEEPNISLKGIIHIVGALGAGKSTYKYAQVVKGIKKEQLRIGMIEESVAHVIETVNTLREMGINAVPIIGSSNERKYMERYLGKFTNYIDLIDDEMIKELSGSCTIKALAEDVVTQGFPCNKLYQGKEKVSCNYATSCGHMYRYRKLADAQVIVTTPHSLVKGSIATTIDPYQRSIYEMLHDLMDMIIVDEADGVQSILEDQLMVRAQLNYGNYGITKQFNELAEKLKEEKMAMKKDDRYKFITNCSLLNLVLGVSRRILNRYTKITSSILNKCVTPIQVFNDIESILVKEKSNKVFVEFLREYVQITDVFKISEQQLDHELNGVFERVSKTHVGGKELPENKLKKEVKKLLTAYQVIIPKNTKGKSYDEERIIEQISFLVILVQIDYLVKILSNEYPYLYYEVYQSMRYIEGFTSPNRKLEHLIKEPCIGSIYGYKISFKEELQIDTLRYAAVGRSMLEKWAYLKEEVGVQGPVVICLSGTSHSPGSAHYHVKKAPDILLSGKKEGEIQMYFCPQVEDSKYIRVSGSREEQRSKKLEALCEKLVKVEVKNELANNQGRKILMIVGSYEDAKVVGDRLAYHKMNFRVICKDEGENYLTKEDIENFEEESESADICVVPLSIIARGYNILNRQNDSYFGSLFFLVRPYMVPGDFSSYIQILHHHMGDIIEDVRCQYDAYTDRIKHFIKRCYSEFNDILNMRYWRDLTDKQREVMTWFMLIPMKQAIGRMQRNGNDCRVYFCDSAFCGSYGTEENLTHKNSTLHSFYNVLGKYKNDAVIDPLFHQFYKGLEKMICKIEQQHTEDNEEDEY